MENNSHDISWNTAKVGVKHISINQSINRRQVSQVEAKKSTPIKCTQHRNSKQIKIYDE